VFIKLIDNYCLSCHSSTKEYKVVFAMNDYGIELLPFTAVNHVAGTGKLAFAKDEAQVIAFAKECVVRLLSANPNAVAYAPILRVDIMRMQNGTWVVNEFESLEALTAKKDHTGDQENKTSTYLVNFWKCDIARIIASN